MSLLSLLLILITMKSLVIVIIQDPKYQYHKANQRPKYQHIAPYTIIIHPT